MTVPCPAKAPLPMAVPSDKPDQFRLPCQKEEAATVYTWQTTPSWPTAAVGIVHQSRQQQRRPVCLRAQQRSSRRLAPWSHQAVPAFIMNDDASMHIIVHNERLSQCFLVLSSGHFDNPWRTWRKELIAASGFQDGARGSSQLRPVAGFCP